ncbi:hypothetical protein PR048_004986 [Dryococelus australis]|uniref:CCHC-type domain-containing protein n=1 Tax=Dryococelus australis TaxID=614101 RepID=A0ABQ9I6Z0_9NEOP|nr:hypothetical protein PR048_004986 [Dryococelus australis]
MGLPTEKYEGLVKGLEREETSSTKLVKARLIIEEKRMNRDAEVEEMFVIFSNTKRKQTSMFIIFYACGEKGYFAKNCAQHRGESKVRGERSAEDKAQEINKTGASVKE